MSSPVNPEGEGQEGLFIYFFKGSSSGRKRSFSV